MKDRELRETVRWLQQDVEWLSERVWAIGREQEKVYVEECPKCKRVTVMIWHGLYYECLTCAGKWVCSSKEVCEPFLTDSGGPGKPPRYVAGMY